jgi:hypothetical protein
VHPYNTARFVQYSKTSVYYNTAYYTNTPYDTSLVGIHTCAHVQIYMHTRPEPAKLCLSASTSPNVCVSNILLAPTHTHIHARAHMQTYTNTHSHTHTHTHTHVNTPIHTGILHGLPCHDGCTLPALAGQRCCGGAPRVSALLYRGPRPHAALLLCE